MLKKVPQRRRKCGWNPIVVLVDMPVLCIARRQRMFLPVPPIDAVIYCGRIFLTSSSLRKISMTCSLRCSSGVYSTST